MSVDRFYVKQLQAATGKDGKPTVVTVEDSIQFGDVHRTRRYEDGTMIVLLKDGHEEAREMKRVANKKGDEEVFRQRVWVQSEIRLMPEDAARFRRATSFFSDGMDVNSENANEEYQAMPESLPDNVPTTVEELPEPMMEQVGPDKFLN